MNQNWSPPRYSIAVISAAVPDGISVQIPAEAGPAMAASPSALKTPIRPHPYDT